MTPAEIQKIRELSNSGFSMRSIAAELHIHRRKVQCALADCSEVVKKAMTPSSKLDNHRGWLLARANILVKLKSIRHTRTSPIAAVSVSQLAHLTIQNRKVA